MTQKDNRDPGTGNSVTKDGASDSDWLYDLVMGSIEPDLTLENLPILGSLYGGETKGENEARMSRYENAFQRFDKKIALMTDDLVADARSKKDETKKKVKEQEEMEHDEEMSEIEKKLSNSSDS